MKKSIFYRIAYLFTMAAGSVSIFSCDALQDTLHSEQILEQEKGIGKIDTESSVYYYNGARGESVKGQTANFVLNLSQLADDSNADLQYTLQYTMDDVIRTVSSGGEGVLSNGKSKYYVNLAPAINLIDGEENPDDSSILFTISLSGLKNAVASGDYTGRVMPKFTKTISFLPLFNEEELFFSTNQGSNPDKKYYIPLNGPIEAVDSEITVTANSSMPDTVFTASVSEDSKNIVITSSNDISGSEFSADFSISGIKPLGSKETYSRIFKNITFEASQIVLDGVLDEELWADSVSSDDSYSDSTAYQNLNKVYITNDSSFVYIALEYEQNPSSTTIVGNGQGAHTCFIFDTAENTNVTTESSSYMVPASTTTYSNDGKDKLYYELATWISNTERVSCSSGLKSSAAYSIDDWDDAEGYVAESKTFEYKISLSSLGASSGDTIKLFVSRSSYKWDDTNKEDVETLYDCIPAGAATVTSETQLAVDFSKALEYTLK